MEDLHQLCFTAGFDSNAILNDSTYFDARQVISAYDTVDDFESYIIAEYPDLAALIVALDVPAKTKSKKQMARERRQRLEAMCASQDRQVLEKRQKMKKPKIRLYRAPESSQAPAPVVTLRFIED